MPVHGPARTHFTIASQSYFLSLAITIKGLSSALISLNFLSLSSRLFALDGFLSNQSLTSIAGIIEINSSLQCIKKF
mgnify:CR=1 FL=1|jgi:hypothetical protein